jgi:plastocyanin
MCGDRLRALAVLVLLPLAACGASGPAHGPAPSDATVVEMTTGLHFTPEQVVIPLGGTVEWRNASIWTHSVTADPERARNPQDVHLPPGAEPFDSGEIPAGEIYRHTFTVPGIYRYVCHPHENDGMAGTIVVSPAG